MAELATRADLDALERATHRDIEVSERATRADIATTRRELETSIAGVRRDLEGAIERQTLRMTVRLGGMIAIAVAILAGTVKL